MAESNKQEKKNLVKDKPIDRIAATKTKPRSKKLAAKATVTAAKGKKAVDEGRKRKATRLLKKASRQETRSIKVEKKEIKRVVKKADRAKKKETRVDARTKRKIANKTTSASKAAGDMGDAKSGSRKETRKYRKMVKKVGQREKLEATKSGKRVAAASKKKKNY
jgi:hypothetical protein